MKTLKSLILCLIVIMGVSSNALAAPLLMDPSIHYVTDIGTPTNSCTNWVADPCDLQTALTKAIAGDQIWVAAGTYRPTTSNPDPRTATFRLKTGVAIYGGFPENGGTWEQRKWEANPTILSGDLAGNDGPNFADNSENSYHVVIGSGVDATAVLDGFTISGGNSAETPPNAYGGGMFNDGGSPSLANVTFSSNSAWGGGGMYNGNETSPTLTNVIFDGNTAVMGGGMLNEFNDESNPKLTNVVFSNNTASIMEGGGMYNSSSSPSLTSVTFISNSAFDGGGMYNYNYSSPTLTNVTFSANTAFLDGGAMFNLECSSPTLTNVTFSGNTADTGGGMYNASSNPSITNTIFWENSNGQIYNGSSSSPSITYSIVQGGYIGDTNITTDDLKLDPTLADNGGFTMTHALQAGSPAIDAGDQAVCAAILTDQRGVSRSIDGDLDGTATCDIGAYEWEIKYYMPLIIK